MGHFDSTPHIGNCHSQFDLLDLGASLCFLGPTIDFKPAGFPS